MTSAKETIFKQCSHKKSDFDCVLIDYMTHLLMFVVKRKLNSKLNLFNTVLIPNLVIGILYLFWISVDNAGVYL